MLRLDLTLDDPLANIALDEALLEMAEVTPGYPEILRLWEPASPLVVLGRSSPIQSEVNHAYCSQHDIPVVRRCSGGQAVVTGKGCLMYAVLLDYRKRPELRMLDEAHSFIMNRMRDALTTIGVAVDIDGTSDLTLGGSKFSGNSMRSKRNWMVYHGTMICELEIELIANCLGEPARQPEYRDARSHNDFLIQLNIPTDQLAEAIAQAWSAESVPFQWPVEKTNELLVEKYRRPEWNFKVL